MLIGGESQRTLDSRQSGFSAHNEVSMAAAAAEGRKKLAGDMLRIPSPVVDFALSAKRV